MAQAVVPAVGFTRLSTTRAGALSAGGAPFSLDFRENLTYRAYVGPRGVEAVQITTPIKAGGGAADIEVRIGGTKHILPGGGQIFTIPGPVSYLSIFALNAAVAGSGSDDVFISPLALLKTRI